MAVQNLTDLFSPAGEFIPGKDSADLDISKGGHFGFAPNHAHWVSEKAYVQRNLILMVLEAPKFMSLMDQPTRWYAALRAFVETQPSAVKGFQAGLKVQIAEHEAGGGGQVQQDFTNVTRERSDPVFEFSSDKEGAVIQNMVSTWITYGMSDPDSNIPLAITLPAYQDQEGTQRNWMADWYSMTFIAFEPNATMTDVVRAWLVTNSYPKESGPIEGGRDVVAGNTVPTRSFPFTAYATYDEGTRRFARDLLTKISFKNANPAFQEPWLSEPDAFISKTDVGYKAGVESVVKNQVQ